jgi:hypothetical protein
MINFPTTPSVGQEHTEAGVIWTWDGVKWTATGLVATYLPLTDPIVTDAPYLQLVGGTMLGPIVLEADPVAPLQPVTEQYFAKYPMIGDNRIINGDMTIDQRNAGVGGTAQGYTVDRWAFYGTQAGVLSWQQGLVSDTGGLALGLNYCLSVNNVSQGPYTPLPTDYFQFLQPIEADMVSDLAWGTPSAQPVTLSFMVSTNVTGTYSGAITNDIGSRSYPFTFNVPAGIWTKVVVTIPGDTAGTWVMSGNGVGVMVHFDLGSGATLRGPGNVWASASYCGANGAVSLVAQSNGQMNITNVKLETGTVATPFNRKSLAESMLDCQRYYQQGQIAFAGLANGSGGAYATGYCPAQMRVNPTITTIGDYSGNFTIASWAGIFSLSGATLLGTIGSAGSYTINASFSLDAEL